MFVRPLNNEEWLYRRLSKDNCKNGIISTSAFKDKRGNLSVNRSCKRKETKIMKTELKNFRSSFGTKKIKNFVGCAKVNVGEVRGMGMYVEEAPSYNNRYHCYIKNSIDDIFLDEINLHKLVSIAKFVDKNSK